MKKLATFIALILVLALALPLTSCTGGGEGEGTSTSFKVESTPAPSTSGSTPGSDTTAAPGSDTTSPVTTSPVTTAPVTTAPVVTTAPAVTTAPPSTEIKWTSANLTIYVSDENVWLRKAPDLDDASRDVVLHFGDALTCTATSEAWFKVSYAGADRYISATYATKDNLSGNDFETVSDTVYVTVDTVWLRRGPSVDTKALSSAVKGTQLARTAKSAGWSKVTYAGATYYISNSCISTTKP